MSFRKRFFLILLTVVFVFHSTVLITADEDEERKKKQEEIEELEKKVEEIQGQKQTLSATIDYLNNKIRLTQAQIDQTQNQLVLLNQQIGALSIQIDQLNSSLDAMSSLLINRIKQTYIRSRIKPMQSLLATNDLSNMLMRYKYLQLTQRNDRQVMYKMETTRVDYNKQKVLKEAKQAELDDLNSRLESQQSSLANQQREKEVLLDITNNDEKKYQKLLSEARAQLAAFRRFTSTQGGASILNGQTKCDDWGCYYNQRDSQWGTLALGHSNLSVAEYGCLVSSVSMIASHQGIDIKPSDIASNTSAFFSNADTALLLWDFSVKGTHVTITSASKFNLDQLLENGPVIAGLYSGPDHFIVIKSKQGDNYIINDPFAENGHDVLLSDQYSYGAISSLRLVNFN